jgi:hypothetical protein
MCQPMIESSNKICHNYTGVRIPVRTSTHARSSGRGQLVDNYTINCTARPAEPRPEKEKYPQELNVP